ncbi:MAG: hypothetical protein ABSC24_01045 [Verrucomicrobiota bacterium]|jgi:hypothetical protein
MFKSTNNKLCSDRFAPCVTGRLLLKTLPAAVGRVVAQKVLLSTRRLETHAVLSDLHCCSFKRNLMNDNTLKCHDVLRGKTSGQETQQTNLITKGRNQRQINE